MKWVKGFKVQSSKFKVKTKLLTLNLEPSFI